jgi:alcohol dehydrogenase class IV
MESLIDFYAPSATRLATGLNMPVGEKTGAELMVDVVEKVRALQTEIGCATDFKRWGADASNMENIITAVASDPVAALFPLPPVKIQEISLKALG